MNHRKPSLLAILAVGAVVSLGAAAIAQQYDDPTSADMMSGVVVTTGTGEIVVETSDGRKTFVIGDVKMPAGLAEGDIVLIDVDSPGSLDAEKVMIVHDHIVVVEDEESEGALLGVVTAISPQQLLVKTITGEQAFVINPEKLFPPLPEANQKVAVTYRTLEVHPPQHMATGLVVLPSDLDALSQSARGESTEVLDSTSGETSVSVETEIAAESVEAETEAETAPVPLAVAETESTEFEPETESQFEAEEDTFAQATEPEPTFDEDEEEMALPQTGSSLPILLGLGALALGLVAVVRSAR